MGVKSLWSLLTPVGRPILLETTEGKVLAIDSSIWIYQFQATMRDKDGRALLNAHVLGFLRRISKLLFYGIKPVFVFDGGAPTLKRSTLRERKEKRSGAAANHAKLAEKLLAAQMRREALGYAYADGIHVTTSSKGKGKFGPPLESGSIVYLEDIDSSSPKTPTKRRPLDPSSSTKKYKFYDHDPYRLPDVDVEEAVAKATRSELPDPRLATEDELRAFIEDMRPEDFDVTSSAFRDLPTEVQYEIVGDLRLKSRQTSYARLQRMLENAPTPLDFSKQQIMNLRQRNTLTQQLLITTDSIGSAHISIPVRIASERNKEYVLMKNEGESGGWILGIKDDGTKSKPIEIDQDEKKAIDIDEDSEEDMEEVPIVTTNVVDPDLREYQQQMALSAIENRAPKRPLSKNQVPITQSESKVQIYMNSEDDEVFQPLFDDSGEDEELAFAIQASLDQRQKGVPKVHQSPLGPTSPSSRPIPTLIGELPTLGRPSSSIEQDVSASPTRLETALSIAGAGPSRAHVYPPSQQASQISFGKPALLSSKPYSMGSPSLVEHHGSTHEVKASPEAVVDSESQLKPASTSKSNFLEQGDLGEGETESSLPSSLLVVSPAPEHEQNGFDSEDDLEDVLPVIGTPLSLSDAPTSHSAAGVDHLVTGTDNGSVLSILTRASAPDPFQGKDDHSIHWSRTPSPINMPSFDMESPEASSNPIMFEDEEIDPAAEEVEFARFISEVKGKGMEEARREIDDEIKFLNQQRKAAMRDSEDVTKQMISQIMTMLRLFGIPYITAPMEAEAQCAELVSLGLVDGVITDDSDVFLFGAQRVFKNMFNQSKTVECFLLPDLERELGLERDTLIRLAYLLGSDYVDGLPGVGPVVAMELLKEFPGEDGLHKFKDWWIRVQSGRDKENESKSKFRKQFKKKFKDLYLPSDWPNPAVRDAYYHPVVDSSDEPFKWGMPDLDALRGFFHAELSWGQAKVDEILLPIIQKMNKRSQAAALNKQSNLNEFFDVAAGSGTYVPRKRQAYTSKRLQQVVDDFRSKRKRKSTSPPLTSKSESENEEPATKRRVTKTNNTQTKPKERSSSSRPRARTRVGLVRAKNMRISQDDDESEGDQKRDAAAEIPPDPVVIARLRPRPAYRQSGTTSIVPPEEAQSV